MVDGCNTSGVLTATKVVVSGSRVRLASVRVTGHGATSGTIEVYDSGTNTTVGKKKLVKMFVGGPAGNEADAKNSHNYEFDMHGAIALEGIYVVVTGTINYSIEYF